MNEWIKKLWDTYLYTHNGIIIVVVQLLSPDSLWPHELQNIRLTCPSVSPGICSNLCPLSQWCHPTISSSYPLLLLPSIFFSIRVFSNEVALCIRWPKYWSFSFSISPSSEYSGLISFRMDCFELFTVQGLSRVFSNTAIWKHQFFSAQPSWQSSSRISTWLLKKLRIMNGFSLL